MRLLPSIDWFLHVYSLEEDDPVVAEPPDDARRARPEWSNDRPVFPRARPDVLGHA